MSRLLKVFGAAPRGEGPHPLPEEAPGIGDLVRVVGVDEDHWLGVQGRPSRVEDVDVDAIAVAAPRGRGDLEPPAEGEEVELRWPSARGVYGLRVRVVERYRDGVALWWCEPTGPLVSVQRRAFVRARASGGRAQVSLTLRDSEEGGAQGWVADLSEGGLRAAVNRWEGEEEEEAVVRVRLSAPTAFDDDGEPTAVLEHEVLGTVLRWLPSSSSQAKDDQGRALVDVCVEFWQPVPQADELRALVFAWQRRERQHG